MPPRPRILDGFRRRPRQERSRALVDAIVQATVELAAERGLEHVSTDHIAARAGVSVGSVYQYFASKDVAVREAIEARARAGNQAMVAQLATIGSLPLEEAIADSGRRPAYAWLRWLMTKAMAATAPEGVRARTQVGL